MPLTRHPPNGHGFIQSVYPFRSLALDHQIGRFVPGARANLVHLTGSLAVARAWVGGCDARELAGAQ